jgi:pSer/pThr/pTyr-binding forkhead associated (FHA) protein
MAVEGELLVGREAPAPQSLIDRLQREFDNVSRRHALLRLVADGLWVEDLASTNGTFVNGVRLQARHAVRLSDGATVRFAADLMATVHVGDA